MSLRVRGWASLQIMATGNASTASAPAEVGGQPRVVDVIAEGTSLRLTTRSEYSAVIQRNGGRVASLLDAMRNQIAQLAARETRS